LLPLFPLSSAQVSLLVYAEVVPPFSFILSIFSVDQFPPERNLVFFIAPSP